MLVHDNGTICVMANTRCGHTSMSHYFGINPHAEKRRFWDWIESSSRRILVLRNPYDRVKSAVITSEYATDKEAWIEVHSKPYLIEIPTILSFEIIDFNRLSEYIPLSRDTAVTNTSSVHHTEIDLTPEMREEYIKYRYFMQHCKQVTPEEWKELTRN